MEDDDHDGHSGIDARKLAALFEAVPAENSWLLASPATLGLGSDVPAMSALLGESLKILEDAGFPGNSVSNIGTLFMSSNIRPLIPALGRVVSAPWLRAKYLPFAKEYDQTGVLLARGWGCDRPDVAGLVLEISSSKRLGQVVAKALHEGVATWHQEPDRFNGLCTWLTEKGVDAEAIAVGVVRAGQMWRHGPDQPSLRPILGDLVARYPMYLELVDRALEQRPSNAARMGPLREASLEAIWTEVKNHQRLKQVQAPIGLTLAP